MVYYLEILSKILTINLFMEVCILCESLSYLYPFYFRYLYWTNRGTRPRIERCDLAGENRQLVATANVRAPRGIAIDQSSER